MRNKRTHLPNRRCGSRPGGFEFPQLNKAGVYVIDFIGAGKSSRALVRKGRLRPLFGMSTAGQTIRVVDEANRPVQGCGRVARRHGIRRR